MKRFLRRPGSWALLGLTLTVALLVAPGATGRGQTGPKMDQEPFISGPYLVQVGTNLTGHKGTWSGKQPITYADQWMRCNSDANNCTKVTNATGTSYTIVKADVGHTLRFQVVASNSDGSTKGLSNATQEIPGSASEPQATAAPTVSGTATVGEKLTAAHGTWKGTPPISYTYAWEDCTADLVSCVLNGATGTSYTVAKADVGKRLLVKVIAKNSVGQNSAQSLPTDTVKDTSGGGGGGGGGNAIPVADVGPAGERLIVDQVTFNPNPVGSRNQPIIVKIRVTDTKGKLVKGALVFIRSTPVVASIPTDAPTGSDGTVTYSIQPRSDFPLKNGYSVQFFVKAYRQGDPSLAGISGTRLVQVATKAP